MGIQGLLPELKSIAKNTSLSELAGQVCGVDTYSWIHRGVFSCATALCLKEETSAYVTYCNNLLSLVLAHGITPILVFDGARLAAKTGTETEREARRALGMRQGQELLRTGREREAHACFTKAVDVTPEMAHRVLLSFRARGVECLVAPFEADAQLAKLYLDGRISFAISEDSDLLAFGCSRVLYKLDRHSACGELIDLTTAQQEKEQRGGNEMQFFTRAMFLDCCILAGCDYLQSVRGVGIKRAMQLVSKYKTTARILRGLRFEYDVPPQYELAFYRARCTFLHQVVYCPSARAFVHLTALPNCVEDAYLVQLGKDWSFVGRCDFLPEAEKRAEAWARGDIHPDTLLAFPPMPTQSAAPGSNNGQRTLDAYFGAPDGMRRAATMPAAMTTNNPFVKKQTATAAAPQLPVKTATSKHFAPRSATLPAPSCSLGGPPTPYRKVVLGFHQTSKHQLFPSLAPPPPQPSAIAATSTSPPAKQLKLFAHFELKQ